MKLHGEVDCSEGDKARCIVVVIFFFVGGGRQAILNQAGIRMLVHIIAWVLAGWPRQGTVLDHKKLTNAKYKYAVHYLCKNEQVLRADYGGKTSVVMSKVSGKR